MNNNRIKFYTGKSNRCFQKNLANIQPLHYGRYDYLKEKRVAMDIWNDYLNDILEKTTIPSSL